MSFASIQKIKRKLLNNPMRARVTIIVDSIVVIVYYVVLLVSIIHDSEAFVKPTRKFLNKKVQDTPESVKYGCYLCVNRSLRVLRGYCLE